MDNQTQSSTKSKLGVIKAISIGQLIINLPVVVIVIGPIAIGRIYFPDAWWLFAIGGVILAWIWWSYTLPRWRKWAIQKGADANALHRAAVLTGLEWPKGWIFEKTEIKTKK